MGISNIIEGIRSLVGQRRRDRLIDVAAAARAIADGEVIDQDEVASLLEESGHTPDQLKEMVSRMVDRRELHRKMKLADAVPERRAERIRKAEIGRASCRERV